MCLFVLVECVYVCWIEDMPSPRFYMNAYSSFAHTNNWHSTIVSTQLGGCFESASVINFNASGLKLLIHVRTVLMNNRRAVGFLAFRPLLASKWLLPHRACSRHQDCLLCYCTTDDQFTTTNRYLTFRRYTDEIVTVLMKVGKKFDKHLPIEADRSSLHLHFDRLRSASSRDVARDCTWTAVNSLHNCTRSAASLSATPSRVKPSKVS